MATEDKRAAMARVKSTVSFADMVDEHDDGVDGDEGHQDQDEDEMLLSDPTRTRVFSVSKDRPITRIPTRVEMKTLTHKAKRPAVDIEFHDLTYAVNTTAGEYFHTFHPHNIILFLIHRVCVHFHDVFFFQTARAI